MFLLNNITISDNGDIQTVDYIPIDIIIPCYVGIHCYNFLLHRYGLTPNIFNYLFNDIMNHTHHQVHNLTRSSYGINNNIWLKNYDSIAVIAGHFSWQVWLHLDTYVQQYMTSVINTTLTNEVIASSSNQTTVTLANNSTYEYISPDDIPPPKCMVIGRHPISRFISYYYQRCFTSPNCVGKLILYV